MDEIPPLFWSTKSSILRKDPKLSACRPFTSLIFPWEQNALKIILLKASFSTQLLRLRPDFQKFSWCFGKDRTWLSRQNEGQIYFCQIPRCKEPIGTKDTSVCFYKCLNFSINTLLRLLIEWGMFVPQEKSEHLTLCLYRPIYFAIRERFPKRKSL